MWNVAIRMSSQIEQQSYTNSHHLKLMSFDTLRQLILANGFKKCAGTEIKLY